MKIQRRFAPTGGEFTPESVARFIGIRTIIPKSSHYASQPSNRGGILQPFPLLLRLQTDLILCHTGVTDFDKTCLIVVNIA
jgi:hypothetical protein